MIMINHSKEESGTGAVRQSRSNVTLVQALVNSVREGEHVRNQKA